MNLDHGTHEKAGTHGKKKKYSLRLCVENKKRSGIPVPAFAGSTLSQD